MIKIISDAKVKRGIKRGSKEGFKERSHKYDIIKLWYSL